MHGILHKAILIWGGSAAYHSKALISLQQDENVSRKVTTEIARVLFTKLRVYQLSKKPFDEK